MDCIRGLKVLLSVAILLAFSGAAFAANYKSISECGNLSETGTVYALANDITSDGTCFSVQAQDVTLDCNGHTMTGSSFSPTIGIYSDQFNTTVKDCAISDFATGIHLSNAPNGTIINTNITAKVFGIVFTSSSGGQIANSNITAGTGNMGIGPGIYFASASSYNQVSNSAISSTSDNGISFDDGSSYNQVSNSAISSISNIGIRLHSGNNQISNSTIASSSSWGIDIHSSGNSISGSTVTGDIYGIFIDGDSNQVSGSTITSASDAGIWIFDDSSYNLVSGSTVASAQGNAISIGANANYNQIINTTAASSDGLGISLDSDSYNTISGSAGTSGRNSGIYLNGATYNTVINSTGAATAIPHSPGAGIWLQASSYNSVSDSSLTSNTGPGIYMDATSSHNLISGSSIASNASEGVSLEGASGNQISNSTISSADNVGIAAFGAANNQISDSIITSATTMGIILSSSSNNTVSGSTVTGETHGIFIDGDSNQVSGSTITSASDAGIWIFDDSSYNLVSGSTVASAQGNAISIGANANYNQIINTTAASSDGLGISLDSDSYNTISGSAGTSGRNSGIYLNGATYNTVINSTGAATAIPLSPGAGIWLQASSYNNVSDSSFKSYTGAGIHMDAASGYNQISGASIASTAGEGILLEGASGNQISKSTISSADNIGIAAFGAANNQISDSSVTSATTMGIILSSSPNNTISGSTIAAPNNIGAFIVSSAGNQILDSTITGNDSEWGALSINGNSENNTVSGSVIDGKMAAYAITIQDGANTGNSLVNNTILKATNLLRIDIGSEGNTICWNNFTGAEPATYVNDSSAGNYYSSSICQGEGNIYANIMDGTVRVRGSAFSTAYHLLYIGKSGTGYPYSAVTSGGKIIGGAVDSAPLTPSLLVSVIGNESAMNSSGFASIGVSINGTEAIGSSILGGTLPVEITDNGAQILGFSYDFSKGALDFSEITITKGNGPDGEAYATVAGIDPGAIAGTKTLYLRNASGAFSHVCIKDAEGVVDVGQISGTCSGEGETLVPCTGADTGGHACTANGTTLTITGLVHSGVEQQNAAAPAPASPSPGSYNGGGSMSGGSSSAASTRSATDVKIDVGGTQCIVTIERSMESSNTSSVLTTTLSNTGGSECTMANYHFADTVPSGFARMGEISFSPAYTSAAGANIEYAFPTFAGGESKTITYTVARWVSPRRAGDFTVYSMSAQKPAQAPTAQPEQVQVKPVLAQQPNATQAAKATQQEAPALVRTAQPNASGTPLAGALFDSNGSLSLGALGVIAISSFVAIVGIAFIFWRKTRTA